MGWSESCFVQVRVLLASTKAAGTGLNLTCACRVIILDVWWTWAHEDQACAAPFLLFATHALLPLFRPSHSPL